MYSVLCELSADGLQRPTGSTRNELFSVLGYTQSNQFCFVRVYARVKHARRVPGVFHVLITFEFGARDLYSRIHFMLLKRSRYLLGICFLCFLLSLLKSSHALGRHGVTSSD